MRGRTNVLLTGAIALSLGAAVQADQIRRKPRLMHFESFISSIGGIGEMGFTVGLFSGTASCDLTPEDGGAQCSDPVGGGVVRFQGGCREVSGAGTCVIATRLDEYYAAGGVVLELICAPSGSGPIRSVTVHAPEGSHCTSVPGDIVECRPLTSQATVLVAASCTDGCPPTTVEGVTCSDCEGGDCRTSTQIPG